MRKIILTAMVSAILLALAACESEASKPPYTQDITHSVSNQSYATLSPAVESAPLLQCTYAPEQELSIFNVENNAEAYFPTCRDDELANASISAYGFQVAADFLRHFTSIFSGISWLYNSWDIESSITESAEQLIFIRCHATRHKIAIAKMPEIYFIQAYSSSSYAFFDRYGNSIIDAPWIYTQRFESYRYGEYHISYTHHYADYFSLFDFDNTGIPDIIVHFSQTFEGCYGGFYRLFRYVDGAYKMLEIAAFSNGEQLDMVSFGTSHEFFIDADDRVISFISCALDSKEYSHFVLGNRVEFHRIAKLAPYSALDEWYAHHWQVWEHTPYGSNLISSWRHHNPTIFGTDIALVPLYPFVDLAAELYMYLYY